MLDEVNDEESVPADSQAAEIVAALEREFGSEESDEDDLSYACEALYTRMQGITGLTLRDSYHLGQTIANDYGRPYQPGFNTVDGAAGSVEFGRFSLYARGEYQHAPGAAGFYSPALAATLSNVDYDAAGQQPGAGDHPGRADCADGCAAHRRGKPVVPHPEPRDFYR